MKGSSGFFGLLVVLAGVIGYVTWSSDQCTVYPGRPFAANVTLQGWGATQQCSQLTTGSVNGVVRLATLGLAGATQAAPSGEIICSGFSGLLHYTVRTPASPGPLSSAGQCATPCNRMRLRRPPLHQHRRRISTCGAS
jgi:hypothetical protein